MGTSQNSLIDYGKPPVVEVVCGVLFNPVGSFLAPHFGQFWEIIKSEYPQCHEVSPLSPTVERFGPTPQPQQPSLEIRDIPPLPRVWFIDKDENGIIQIQRDRFLYNWRKVRPDDKYPRYYFVVKKFQNHFSQFQSFLRDNDLGEISSRQYEMTYINHILQGKGWEEISQIGAIFPDFHFRAIRERFLPPPESLNWRTSFVLPESMGRLHVSIQQAIQRNTNRRLLLLDLTVRGIGEDKSPTAMKGWFDLAHEWIVYGFADLTGREVQARIWKRKE